MDLLGVKFNDVNLLENYIRNQKYRIKKEPFDHRIIAKNKNEVLVISYESNEKGEIVVVEVK